MRYQAKKSFVDPLIYDSIKENVISTEHWERCSGNYGTFSVCIYSGM